MSFFAKKLILSSCVLFVTSMACHSAYASLSNDQSNANNAQNSWIMGAGGGLTWINLPNNEYIANATSAPPPYDHDQYTVSGQRTGIFQYLVGYRWLTDAQYFPFYSLFIQYSHFFQSHISGEVTQFTVPTFENYNYKVSYSADMFTVNGKFDFVKFYSMLPFIGVGVGAIFNHINSYDESPLAGVTPRTSPGYQGNSQTKLAGTIDAGLDFVLSNNYWLTLGYEHVFQGDLMSGSGTDTWAGTKMNFGNAKMDTAYLVLTANFPQGFRG